MWSIFNDHFIAHFVVCQWKNFRSLSIFGEVVTKTWWLTFWLKVFLTKGVHLVCNVTVSVCILNLCLISLISVLLLTACQWDMLYWCVECQKLQEWVSTYDGVYALAWLVSQRGLATKLWLSQQDLSCYSRCDSLLVSKWKNDVLICLCMCIGGYFSCCWFEGKVIWFVKKSAAAAVPKLLPQVFYKSRPVK